MLGVETSDDDVESGEDRCMENQRVVPTYPVERSEEANS